MLNTCNRLFHAHILVARRSLIPPGHPSRDIALNNIFLGLKCRYQYPCENLNEAINLQRESLRLLKHCSTIQNAMQPFSNLSSVLSCRFTQNQNHKDIEKVIGLRQDS
ncbi:hypothetical protein BD769DRAFT_1370111 [Suillus cothurnatus]|nr:hypothetical protein BD769DRAFT_1370111 [Suillus cothurnatus]